MFLYRFLFTPGTQNIGFWFSDFQVQGCAFRRQGFQAWHGRGAGVAKLVAQHLEGCIFLKLVFGFSSPGVRLQKAGVLDCGFGILEFWILFLLILYFLRFHRTTEKGVLSDTCRHSEPRTGPQNNTLWFTDFQVQGCAFRRKGYRERDGGVGGGA